MKEHLKKVLSVNHHYLPKPLITMTDIILGLKDQHICSIDEVIKAVEGGMKEHEGNGVIEADNFHRVVEKTLNVLAQWVRSYNICLNSDRSNSTIIVDCQYRTMPGFFGKKYKDQSPLMNSDLFFLRAL